MARFKFVVMTRPVEGRDAEYNRWYQDQHLDDILSVEGFVAAQRFRRIAQVSGEEGQPYLAIYEIEAEDGPAALDRLKAFAASGAMFITDAMDRDIFAAMYEELGERVER